MGKEVSSVYLMADGKPNKKYLGNDDKRSRGIAGGALSDVRSQSKWRKAQQVTKAGVVELALAAKMKHVGGSESKGEIRVLQSLEDIGWVSTSNELDRSGLSGGLWMMLVGL